MAFTPSPIAHGQFTPIVVGDLLFGSPHWWWPSIALSLVMTVLVIWNYAHRSIPSPIRIVAGLLKILAVVLIAICLLEPLQSGTRPRPQANLFPIVVDNSRSMRLKSTTADLTRGETVVSLLGEDLDWRVRLAQSFDVRTYAFDARLESVDDYESLPMDGHVSSLAGSLQSLAERFAGRPVGGVLLFTDGNLTDSPPSDFDWSKFGFPVYPVLRSDAEAIRDLRISDLSVRQTDFESAPVTVRVKVDGVAMKDEKVTVQLVDVATKKTIEEKSTRLNSLVVNGTVEDSQEVRFIFRPEGNGVRFYRVNVFTEDDRKELEDGIIRSESVTTQEATLANNRRMMVIDRATGPYRILYVAGRPNWEFKFLRRALQEDAEIQLVGLLRIAKKESKFSFRDQHVNDTNPLFAGLGDDEEETAQQYDQPVILRLGVNESEELSAGFPESPDELFAYHGIVLDDIETGFFTQDQMLLIRRFVAARGGGLLMLGGNESFAEDSFAATPLGELSAVYAPRGSEDNAIENARLQLTREGLLQPWLRLRENEVAEEERLSSMPKFLTVNPVGELKPGASSLATIETDDGGTFPAVVAQRFGKGKSAAITIGDLWRWSLNKDPSDSSDAAQAWRQICRWLVNDVPQRAELRIESSGDASDKVTIVATARDEAYLPLDNALVELEIVPLSGQPFTMIAEADGQVAGKYTASYWSAEPGGYHVRAKIRAADGSEIGTAEAGWTVQTDAAEFAQLQINRDWLTNLAQQTGGGVVDEDELNAFVTDLPNRRIPITESWVYPVWHQTWVMLAAMLLLCIEWGLRRWKGLA